MITEEQEERRTKFTKELDKTSFYHLEDIFGVFNEYMTLDHDSIESYIVGGAIRDLLTGKTAKDFDIVTNIPYGFLELRFEKAGWTVSATGKAFLVISIQKDGRQYEIANFRKDGVYLDGRRPETVEIGTLEEDANRRDFTVNALYYNYNTGELKDPTEKGFNDIKRKVLRFIGKPKDRIKEDYLRIFRFYRFLAAKDIFKLDLSKHNQSSFQLVRKTIGLVLYTVKYLIMFPVFAFFWFLVLVVLLSFMSKDQQIENVMLVSMAIVGSIRVAAYYNEDLSRDLAKILPFAMLGIMLIDSSILASVSTSIGNIREIGTKFELILYYLILIVAMEFVLRSIYLVMSSLMSYSDRLQKKESEKKTAKGLEGVASDSTEAEGAVQPAGQAPASASGS